MVDIIPAACEIQTKLETVGYVAASALSDNLLCCEGEIFKGHESHFSRMKLSVDEEKFHWAFKFRKMRDGKVYKGGFARDNVLASYLHMHFAGNVAATGNFIEKCKAYSNTKG